MLPLLIKVQKQSLKKSAQLSVVLSALQSTEVTNFIAITQRKVLHCVHSLFKASMVPLSESITAASSVSYLPWEEVIQARLNLPAVLEAHYKELSSVGKPLPLAVSATASHLHVVNHVSVDDSELMLGAMVSDYLRYNDAEGSVQSDNIVLVTSLLTQSSSSGASSSSSSSHQEAADRAEKLLVSLNVEDSVYSLIRVKAFAASSSTIGAISSSTSNPKSSSSSAAPAAASVSDEAFETIKAIFPDLGEGFIEACLQVYQNKSEQVIDALLSNNLNPKLLLIDRKMKKMWKGKQNQEIAMYSAGGVSSKAASRDEIKADLAFKETQKARFRAAEKQAEYDSYIIMSNAQVPESSSNSSGIGTGKVSSAPLVCKIERDDYNDDYDDQVSFLSILICFALILT